MDQNGVLVEKEHQKLCFEASIDILFCTNPNAILANPSTDFPVLHDRWHISVAAELRGSFQAPTELMYLNMTQ
jgi:hypothetical protein